MRLNQYSSQIELPIVGNMVASICVHHRRSPEIIFSNEDDQESSLILEDQINLTRGEQMIPPHAIHRGNRTDGGELSPLLTLLGSTVREAFASQDGRLTIKFSNAINLTITSTTGYEAWHFQYPRIGSQYQDNKRKMITIHGAYGKLL